MRLSIGNRGEDQDESCRRQEASALYVEARVAEEFLEFAQQASHGSSRIYAHLPGMTIAWALCWNGLMLSGGPWAMDKNLQVVILEAALQFSTTSLSQRLSGSYCNTSICGVMRCSVSSKLPTSGGRFAFHDTMAVVHLSDSSCRDFRVILVLPYLRCCVSICVS